MAWASAAGALLSEPGLAWPSAAEARTWNAGVAHASVMETRPQYDEVAQASVATLRPLPLPVVCRRPVRASMRRPGRIGRFRGAAGGAYLGPITI